MLISKKQHAFVLWLLVAGNVALVAINWFITLWRFRLSADFIALHSTIYFGFDRFGPRTDIFLFATLGSAILALNVMIARMALQKNGLWQGALLGLTLFLELMLLLSLVLIILKGA